MLYSTFEKARIWAVKVGIIEASYADAQLQQVVDEVLELEEAHNGNGSIPMEGGDIFVALTIYLDLKGYNAEHCMQMAIDKINKRKGAMKDGRFVKNVSTDTE